MIRNIRIFALLLIILAPSLVRADNAYSMFLRDGAKAVNKSVIELIEPKLTREEKILLRSIEFNFSPSWNVNAYAYNVGSRRIIRIDNGYLASVDQLSLAYVVDSELGYLGCYEEYVNDLLHAISINSPLAAKKKSANVGVDNIWLRARDNASACHGLTSAEFTSNPKAGRSYASYVEASLSFVFLHEIAHHILDHVKKYAVEITLSHSRQMETDADVWAFEKGLSIKVNPAAGLPTWVFLSALDGADLSKEQKSTHPINLRRFHRMLEYVLAHNETEGYIKTFGSPMDEEVVNQIEGAIIDIEVALGL